MKNDIEYKIQQILISFRSDGYSEIAMRSIVVLAEKLKADIRGLFVEDEDLMHVANLPFSREIILPTANVRNLDRMVMLRRIRNFAENLQKEINQYAQSSNVSCTFVTREGPLIESTLSESREAQLIILMPEKYRRSTRKKIDNLAQIINPAVMFYDDSPQARKAILVVRSLIDNNDLNHLTVLTADPEHEGMAKEHLKSSESIVGYYHIDNYSVKNIVAMFVNQKPGLVVFPLEEDIEPQSSEIKQLLDVLGCILIMVR